LVLVRGDEAFAPLEAFAWTSVAASADRRLVIGAWQQCWWSGAGCGVYPFEFDIGYPRLGSHAKTLSVPAVKTTTWVSLWMASNDGSILGEGAPTTVLVTLRFSFGTIAFLTRMESVFFRTGSG
jgi:hypothetical protein